MSNRDYINEDINGLEIIVTKNSSNEGILYKIRHELSYRKKRKKTISLLNTVENFLSQINPNTLFIKFPSCWISENIFEETLVGHDFSVDEIFLLFPKDCKIMVNSAIKLLSFINQLAKNKNKVSITFDDGFSGTMSYLYRMNFFDNLSSNIHVFPKLSSLNNSKHFGKNKKLVEIIPVNISAEFDDSLPGRLASSIVDNAPSKVSLSDPIKNKIKTVVTTLFSELTANIKLHSGTSLPGYAVCQIYKHENKYVAHVAVSDSGLGLLETLRPKLIENYPEKPHYYTLPDNKLVLEIFKTGLSSTNAEAGCGLVTCALQALKFNASVCVRIKDNSIKLIATNNGYKIDTSYNQNQLVSIQGTTITFEFPLGNLTKQ